ncbi:MAG: Dyp-type peroxidase [Dehalococcoidia bacterium]|nr:Dyp-type peroxidase [Dehalococcoidia bacterium]
MTREEDPIDLSLRFEGLERVERVLPDGAHVRLANQDAAGIHFLRRSYSFSDGIERGTGLLDVGLFFLAYQRDPRRQFVPMQSNLSHSDHLNAFTSHVGSAIFAMLPGVETHGFLGEELFEAS